LKLSLSSEEIKHNLKTSKSLKFGDLLFRYVNSDKPGIGFMVSRKYGNAVRRNLFRRRCRAAFHQYAKQSSLNISLVVRPLTSQISYSEIEKAFLQLETKLSH
jgi:ribonuclease P protein component